MATDKLKWFFYGWVFCGIMWIGSHVTVCNKYNNDLQKLKEQIRIRDSVNQANKEVLEVYNNRVDSLQQFVVFKRW